MNASSPHSQGRGTSSQYSAATSTSETSSPNTVETTMYWRGGRGEGARGPPTRWREGAAVDDEKEQQHQDEAKVRDDPGDPDQHLLQDTSQAVEVEPADRGVELLLGDAELAEPAGGLVGEPGELGLVAGGRGAP